MKFIAKYGRKTPVSNSYVDQNGNTISVGGMPTGVILALRDENGVIRFGWSSCDNEDNFTKKRGVAIAKSRALKGVNKPIPSSLSGIATTHFVERCETYFNEKDLSLDVFVMKDGKKKLFKVDSSSTQEVDYDLTKACTECANA
jgi:hypothetical protein